MERLVSALTFAEDETTNYVALTSDFMSRLDEIEKAVKAIAVYTKEETKKIEEKIEEKELPEEISEKLSKIDEIEEKFESLRKELEELKAGVPPGKDYSKDIEDLRRQLKASDYTKIESYVKSELDRFDSMLKGVTQQDFSKMRAISEEMGKKLQEIEEISKRAAEFDASLGKKRVDLDTNINKKFADIDTNFNKKMADLSAKTDQKLSDIDSGIEQRIKKIEGADAVVMQKRMDKIEGEIGTRNLLNIERRLAILEDETKKLEETRKLLEDESVYRVSLEKKISDMEKKLNYVEKSKPARFEADITPIMTRRLDEFSRALDRKFPELITRDEFNQFAAQTRVKPQYPESVNVGSLQKRMDLIERKLGDLTHALKSLINRIPVVVE